jgi:glycosyltransferase involved in cell wall biosynthesis
LLVGDGDRLGTLQSLAQRLSLNDNIRWLGYQKDPRPYLSIADLFLLPSTAVETFSLALLEALSMGKPVLATDIGGSSEIVIEGVNGFLVKPKDVRSLSEKLGRLVENRELREAFGAKARGSVVQRYHLSNMISKTEGLLMEIASGDS